MNKYEKYGLDRCNLESEYINAPMSHAEFKDLIRNSATQGFKILDAGAGEGKDKELFAEKNIEYKGVDSGVGHKSWDYSDVINADLEDMSFVENETFDLVLLIQVMEHLNNPQIVLKELNRVSKKGAKIYIATPQSQSVHQVPYDFYRFTPYGLKYLLENNGYKVNMVRPQLYGDNIANIQRMNWSIDYSLENDRLNIFQKITLNIYKLNLKIYKYFLREIDKKSKRHIAPIGYFIEATKIAEV